MQSLKYLYKKLEIKKYCPECKKTQTFKEKK